ncbi:MotA/TolQ/ExbB proton channel family protein [Prevotella koreensis]|uniref:MotA/TolQ/ExbB proton channel family protein n=1 Tax=Prevotella koreensis TaxID=2490854 RepID=A0A432LKB8_9BACT|nr:MotA/TolQ/ExbB proton channel family protein [Prevotella koreensis]RUL59268.1 MotA/TolQ/ExbB proton channel family protein [Prevotella koreensis]
MTYISDFLFWISTGLLVPVIILLLIFFGRSLVLIGTFFGRYINVRKMQYVVKKEFETLSIDNIEGLEERLPKNDSSLLMVYAHRILEVKDSRANVERLLAQYEVEADKDMGVSKTLSKLGPVLGLMGTLIPMGPALVGLSTGDIASMAYNMQVAFATTVVGLFSGAVGVVTLQVKRRWYMQDIIQLEFLSELLNNKNAKV